MSVALTISTACKASDFKLTLSPKVHQTPFSGSVYLFFSQKEANPKDGPNWFHPEPFLRLEVLNWQPGEVFAFDLDDPRAVRFPSEFPQINDWQVQAVARLNPHDRGVGKGVGNAFSATTRVNKAVTELTLDKVVQSRAFQETAEIKYFRCKSKRLSDFHGRDIFLQAGVLLPPSYNGHPERNFPVIFEIPGFGGNHRHIRQRSNRVNNSQQVEFIRVMLDPECPLGHHVFANSANNGPYGDALVEEFIPAFDATFRTDARPEARFLTGHSSGGWSSLWLMVQYPQSFGGVWSTSPDPVDFRDFQRINIYRPGENMFRTEQNEPRPLARVQGEVKVWYRDFSEMERVRGYGEQLHSFEAVFSPRGSDGKPMLLWNRQTGEIDTQVAESWKPYDIRLYLEQNWAKLQPLLQGKLHVYMGTEDTFYLEGATRLLKESLERLPGDAEVVMLEGKTHFDIFQEGLGKQIEQQMADAYVRHLPETTVR